jgi:hypothetical protein
MAKSKNTPIKLPSVLICLGQVREVKTEDSSYKFLVKDKVMLYSNTKGDALYCMAFSAKEATKEDFEKAVKSKQAQVSKGLDLYEDWNEKQSCSGSLAKKPRGFLFDAGRATSITYKWAGDNKAYKHEFKKHPKARVNKRNRPTLLVLTGGKIAVKKVGITG